MSRLFNAGRIIKREELISKKKFIRKVQLVAKCVRADFISAPKPFDEPQHEVTGCISDNPGRLPFSF